MPISTSFHVQKTNKWLLWHHRLGHPSDIVLRTTLSSCSSTVSCNDSISSSINHCKHCLSGKMHKLPFNKFVFLPSKPFELGHSDVCGPAPITSTNDFRYYLVFIDEFSKFTWVYLLKNKSDVFDVFKYFKAYIETQLHTQIKILRTDGGGEYTSNVHNHFCSSYDIIHQTLCPHTFQQNGTAKRKHRHLIKYSITMLSHSNLPLSYWSYVVSTATHIINRLLTPLLHNKSPWEVLFKSKPDLLHLRTFGCTCFPLLKPYNKHKFQPHTTHCIFLGYPAYSTVYICLDPNTLRFTYQGMSYSMNLSF